MSSPEGPPKVTGPVLIMAGPTAVGKTTLAVSVAEAVGAAVVSADSRQVFRGMTVGTASPTAEDRERVPHRLFGELEPASAYSAGSYRDDCQSAITELHRTGIPALVTGGSTLYIHALVRGIADLPALTPDVLEHVQAEAQDPQGRSALFAELSRADPEGARTLDPTKSQRLVRLVGLLRQTGTPPSELWERGRRPPLPHRLIVLDRPRSELYHRIDERVDVMFAEGIMDETRDLLSAGPGVRALLDSTIGYREVAAMLDGSLTETEARRLIKRNTRRYAKRQLTWFRRYDEAVWLDARTASVEEVLAAAAPWPSMA